MYPFLSTTSCVVRILGRTREQVQACWELVKSAMFSLLTIFGRAFVTAQEKAGCKKESVECFLRKELTQNFLVEHIKIATRLALLGHPFASATVKEDTVWVLLLERKKGGSSFV